MNRNIPTQSQKNTDSLTNNDPSKEQERYAAFLSRRESISGESPTSFPEDTSIPYSRLEPPPGVSAKMLQTSRRGRGQQDDSKYIGNAGSEMLS
ncbi:hypothetical protein TNCV_3370461 [Trichonephila clavipes]|nr:hypothetical protein TNCV_3370461 [Trichonephila clavipes]